MPFDCYSISVYVVLVTPQLLPNIINTALYNEVLPVVYKTLESIWNFNPHNLITTINVLMLHKLWYTQTHLKIINLLRGPHGGYLSTTSITCQIDHHYINVSIFWGEVKDGSLYNPYVLVLICVFIPLQLILRPIYVLIYLYKVVVTLLSVHNYAYSSITS